MSTTRVTFECRCGKELAVILKESEIAEGANFSGQCPQCEIFHDVSILAEFSKGRAREFEEEGERKFERERDREIRDEKV